MVWKISISLTSNRIHHLQRIPCERSCLHSSDVEPFHQQSNTARTQTQTKYNYNPGIETKRGSQPVLFPECAPKTSYHFIIFEINFETELKTVTNNNNNNTTSHITNIQRFQMGFCVNASIQVDACAHAKSGRFCLINDE